MDIRKFCKRLFRLVLRITGFILSCAFSVIFTILFLAFRILKAFLSTYLEPLPEENRPKKHGTIYRLDEKGRVIIDADGMSEQYPII